MSKLGKTSYVLLHWRMLLWRAFRDTLSWLFVAVTLIGSLIAFLPENEAVWLRTTLHFFMKNPWTLLLLFLIFVCIATIVNWPRTRAAYKDKKSDIWVIIECCDLLEQKGTKVIHMVDTFDSELGRIISPQSLHGAFLQLCKEKQVPIDDLLNAQLAKHQPIKENSNLPGKTNKYALGTVCPIDIKDERFCCVAFTKLQPNGTIEISKNDYIRCLKNMWRNLADPRIRGEELNVAVMGNRFVDLPAEFSTEQKIDLMIQTFFAVAREKSCCRVLRICVHPNNIAEIDFEHYPTIIEHLAKRPVI